MTVIMFNDDRGHGQRRSLFIIMRLLCESGFLYRLNRQRSFQCDTMIPVKLLMAPVEKLVTIDLDETIRRASQLMRDHKIGCLLVTKGEVMGIVTETDLVRRVMAEGMNPEQTPVGRVMTSPILKIGTEAMLLEANDLMAQRGVRHLGVERDGRLVGLVSVRDLLNFLTKYPRR